MTDKIDASVESSSSPSETLIEQPLPQADESSLILAQIRRRTHAAGAELLKTQGAMALSFKGESHVLGRPVPYALIPNHGAHWKAKGWRGLAPAGRLKAVEKALSQRVGRVLAEEVDTFLMKAELFARKNGVPPDTAYAALLSPAHHLSERMSVVMSRLEQQAALLQLNQAAQKVQAAVSLALYPESFDKASAMHRKFVAILGEPNSGKTYEAMQELIKAKTGVYLAPLRLLALEGFETLTDAGVPTSLITGEERRIHEDATHIASTVEMLDPSRLIEVAVIDEVQMLADPDRGSAWTAALCGVPAKVVYLVGSLTARPAVESLARRLNCELEVRVMTRKSPLKAEPTAVGAVNRLAKGDALIAFSRRDVLQWAASLTNAGYTVATIYGNLTPEVRQAQAQRFRDGDADLLVATDAIGLGLNLPISRVIFTTATKYDGSTEDVLPVALAHQIAGRAGRFGIKEAGSYAGFDGSTHKVVTRLLREPLDLLPTKGFRVSPSYPQLSRMSIALNEDRLAKLLMHFSRNVDVNDEYFLPSITTEQQERAEYLDTLSLTLAARFDLSLVPLNTRIPGLRAVWEHWAKNIADQSRLRLKNLLKPWRTLQEAEDACKSCSAYAWMAYRHPVLFPDGEEAVARARKLSSEIDDLLVSQNRGRLPRTGRTGRSLNPDVLKSLIG